MIEEQIQEILRLYFMGIPALEAIEIVKKRA